MISQILIVTSLLLVVGVIVTALLAVFAPTRLVTEEGLFRYDLAVGLLFFWWFSLIILFGWLLLWPARKLVFRRVTPNR